MKISKSKLREIIKEEIIKLREVNDFDEEKPERDRIIARMTTIYKMFVKIANLLPIKTKITFAVTNDRLHDMSYLPTITSCRTFIENKWRLDDKLLLQLNAQSLQGVNHHISLITISISRGSNDYCRVISRQLYSTDEIDENWLIEQSNCKMFEELDSDFRCAVLELADEENLKDVDVSVDLD